VKNKIEFWQPCVGKYEYELIKEVLDSNYLNEGAVTDKFEKELAALLGVKYAIAVTSGTAALFLALYALGIGPGDEVIVPDLTFIATANAVTMCGARAVLVDIDADTFNMSPVAFAGAITKQTKAVIPVHMSGRAANLPEIMDIAEKRNIAVIEDAAQALMSLHNGKPLGTYGLMGCFSFSPNKTITTGQGGLVITNDDNLNVRLHQLKDQGRAVRGNAGDDLHPVVGFNFKFTNLQSAIGLGQLQMLETRVKRLRQTYSVYKDMLKTVPGIRLLDFNVESGETPQWIDALVDNRNELEAALSKKNIYCRRFYYPLHKQKPYFQDDRNFPNSSNLLSKAIWLPSDFTLGDEDITKVCEEIMTFMRASRSA